MRDAFEVHHEFDWTRVPLSAVLLHHLRDLLTNAVGFMDKSEGKIEIDCVQERDYWKFGVTDNGPGIDEKHFDRIFKMFQTLSARDCYESTGVGLTITKKIVELQGGKIWLKSTPGKGSTFFFTLPKDEEPVKAGKVLAAAETN